MLWLLKLSLGFFFHLVLVFIFLSIVTIAVNVIFVLFLLQFVESVLHWCYSYYSSSPFYFQIIYYFNHCNEENFCRCWYWCYCHISWNGDIHFMTIPMWSISSSSLIWSWSWFIIWKKHDSLRWILSLFVISCYRYH